MNFSPTRKNDKVKQLPDGRLRVRIDNEEYVKSKEEWARICKRILFNCGYEFDMSTATLTKLEPMTW